MGIGVKYYNSGNRKAFNLDGVPAEGSEEDRLIRGEFDKHAAQSRRKMTVQGKTRVSMGDMPEFIGDKLGGSLVESLGGKICLHGEETDMSPEGRRVYGSRDGRRGWFGMDDIDAPGACVKIGPEAGFSDVEADTAMHRSNGGGFEISVSARAVLANIEIAGFPAQGVYAFTRKLRFTPGGRLFEIGPEQRQLLGIVRGGGGASASSSKFGSRPSPSDSPNILFYIDFGTESDLDTYDPDTNWYASETSIQRRAVYAYLT